MFVLRVFPGVVGGNQNYTIILLLFSIKASFIVPLWAKGPSHVFLEFRPYNSVAVHGPEQINADDGAS